MSLNEPTHRLIGRLSSSFGALMSAVAGPQDARASLIVSVDGLAWGVLVPSGRDYRFVASIEQSEYLDGKLFASPNVMSASITTIGVHPPKVSFHHVPQTA